MGYSKTSLFECFGIFQDFSFCIFFFFSERSYRQNNKKYCYLQPSSLHFLITTKSKQNAVSRYIHSFIDASDEFHNVRARRTLLEGSFLTSCFIFYLSLSLCRFCFDLQRSTIEKWLVIDFIYIYIRRFRFARQLDV